MRLAIGKLGKGKRINISVIFAHAIDRALETTSSDEKQVYKHDFFQYTSKESHATLSDAGVAELVEHLNANKAGLADCLLQVASRLIELDVEHGLSAELGDSMLDIISQLQEGLQDAFMDLSAQVRMPTQQTRDTV